MSINVELADAARWIASLEGMADHEKAERWHRLTEALADVRPSADGAKVLTIVQWREDIRDELAARVHAPLE